MKDLIKKLKNRQAGIYGNKNIFLYCIIAFIVLGYVFFFTSPYTMPNIKNYHYTELNTDIELDNYTLQVGRWEWAEKSNTMEIELNVKKQNYSIFSDLKFTVICRPASNDCKIKKVYSDDEFMILQVKNLPTNFTELAVEITSTQEQDQNYDTDSSNATLINSIRIYTNCDKVKKVDEVKTLAKDDYIKNRLKRLLKQYNADINSTNALIDKCNKKIEKLNAQIKELQDKKIYQTQEELEDTDSQISAIQNSISDINSDIVYYNETIAEYENKIKKAEQKLNDLM